MIYQPLGHFANIIHTGGSSKGDEHFEPPPTARFVNSCRPRPLQFKGACLAGPDAASVTRTAYPVSAVLSGFYGPTGMRRFCSFARHILSFLRLS